EVSRCEAKGKTTTEWARLTPAGVRFLHERESPLRALEALRDALEAAKHGAPAWLTEMRQDLQKLETRVSTEAQRFMHHLEVLSERVEEGLRKLRALSPSVPAGLAEKAPWATEALTYLEQRQTADTKNPCPLPELFAALSPLFPALSMSDFH